MSDNQLDHARDGFKVVSSTSAITGNFYGGTFSSDADISDVQLHPDYAGRAGFADMAAVTTEAAAIVAMGAVPAAGYYPIRCTSITLSAGKAFMWEI